jgi:hypothetical protein
MHAVIAPESSWAHPYKQLQLANADIAASQSVQLLTHLDGLWTEAWKDNFRVQNAWNAVFWVHDIATFRVLVHAEIQSSSGPGWLWGSAAGGSWHTTCAYHMIHLEFDQHYGDCMC